MPVVAGLPSPATMWFNRPIKGLLPQMSRELINVNSYDMHYVDLEAHQKNMIRTLILKTHPFAFLTGVRVAVQWKDGWLWMHGVIVEPNAIDHRACPCNIQVTKTDRLITTTQNTYVAPL